MINEKDTVGIKTKLICPLCKTSLLKNKLNQIWCSNVYCRYGMYELIDFYWHNYKRLDVKTRFQLSIDRLKKKYKIVA